MATVDSSATLTAGGRAENIRKPTMNHSNTLKANAFKVTAMEPVTTTLFERLKSLASLVALPILVLTLLLAIGHGLDGIVHEGQVDNLTRPRHVNASPAAFGIQRAIADRAAEMDDDGSE
jgi:hypothetical protein